MKHDVAETIELIAWLVLGVVLGIAMLPAAANMPGYDVGTQDPMWFAVQIVGVIVLAAALFWFFSTYWDVIPKWVQWAAGGFGLAIILYGWSRLALLGVLFLAGKSVNPPLFSIALVAVGAALLWLAGVRKAARNIVVRSMNIIMLLIIGAVSAIVASKLSLVAAVVFIILLAAYDAIAVWKTGSMQKMAVEMIAAGLPVGLMVPKKKAMTVEGKSIDVALLGYGDVMVIVVVGGALLPKFGVLPIIGMIAAVVWLFVASKPGKFYPAVPYILVGLLGGALLMTGWSLWV